MPAKLIFRAVLFIGAITVVSGLAQLIAPQVILGIVGGESTPTSRHFFGIIGMFMVLFGGLLLQSLLTAGNNSVAVLWAGLQKFGAAAAVGLAVVKGILGPLALSVAGFDLLSGVLILIYRQRTGAARKSSFNRSGNASPRG